MWGGEHVPLGGVDKTPPIRHDIKSSKPILMILSNTVSKSAAAKTRGMWLYHNGENFMILTSTAFCLIHQYNRQRDGQAIAYSAPSIYATVYICCRALKMFQLRPGLRGLCSKLVHFSETQCKTTRFQLLRCVACVTIGKLRLKPVAHRLHWNTIKQF